MKFIIGSVVNEAVKIMKKAKIMKKNIAVSKETREKIARLFNVTMRSVWNALNLDYPETDLTKRIRKVAKENGGVVMTSIPAGEALFSSTAR